MSHRLTTIYNVFEPKVSRNETARVYDNNRLPSNHICKVALFIPRPVGYPTIRRNLHGHRVCRECLENAVAVAEEGTELTDRQQRLRVAGSRSGMQTLDTVGTGGVGVTKKVDEKGQTD